MDRHSAPVRIKATRKPLVLVWATVFGIALSVTLASTTSAAQPTDSSLAPVEQNAPAETMAAPAADKQTPVPAPSATPTSKPVTAQPAMPPTDDDGTEADPADTVNVIAPPSSDPQEDFKKVEAADLMHALPDGQFHPENTVTRAELAKILVKTFHMDALPLTKRHLVLSDVPSTYWASREIQIVMSRGVMSGYHNNGDFYPGQQVTRAEALAIFGQAYGVQQISEKTIAMILSKYPDAGKVPTWARKAMATSLKNGFVNATPNDALRPMQLMTRGDMAYALSRYLDRLHVTERKAL